ncbi:MAG TPA: type II toxin-antitoxin system VapC family toxin [Terracidiphilus sp.]|nr:type II toxin-antitoxin system VapC family toxin [Terracidiphilus sp.]
MKLLLDTHLLLWATEKSPRLSAVTAKLIDDPTNEVYFSVASLWEVTIKHAKRPAGFKMDPPLFRWALLANDYSELEIASRHVLAVSRLPPIHSDPFDRLLIAQAITEGFTLVTTDVKVSKYPGPIRKV